MNFVKTFLLFIVSVVAFGQNLPPLSLVYIQNDTSTGTTFHKLVKLNSSGQAVRMGTSDTSGGIGVCVGNCGTTGTAAIAYAGTWPVIVDGTTTAQHYLKISSSVAGDGADTGASTYPTSGQVIGRVVIASTGAASESTILLGAEVQAAASGAGDVVGPGSATDNCLARYDGTTGKLLQMSGLCVDDSGNATATGALVSGAALTLPEIAAPSGASGKGVFYTKSDHKPYVKLNNGSEDQLCTLAVNPCVTGTSILSSGLGYYKPLEYTWEGVQTAPATFSSGVVWTYQFTVTGQPLTIDAVGVYMVAGCTGACGVRLFIFDSAKTTKVFDTGALTYGGTPDMNQSTVALTIANAAGTVTLNPGVYWMGACTDSTAVKFLVPLSGSFNSSAFAWRMNNFPSSVSRSGTAANSCTGSAGSLAPPSSLGAISADFDQNLAPAFMLLKQ